VSDRAAGGRGLELLAATHTICRLDPDADLPAWARAEPGAVLSVTRSAEELSIVCAAALVPVAVEGSGRWRALRVGGTLAHSEIGVLAALATPLAAAGIPILAISSFDTDYVLVPDAALDAAVEALEAAGHRVR
jgi:uncharacterized protein